MSPIVFSLIVFSAVFLAQPGSLGKIEEFNVPGVLPDQEVVKAPAIQVELPPEFSPQQRADNALQRADAASGPVSMNRQTRRGGNLSGSSQEVWF